MRTPLFCLLVPALLIGCASSSGIRDLRACKSKCEGSVTRVFQFDGSQDDCVFTNAYPCAPWACDGDGVSCRTSCSTNKDCSAGAVCSAVKNECVTLTYSCKDAATVIASDGHESSCAPYRCTAGQCQPFCLTGADCAGGYQCQAETQKCVKK